MVESSFHSNTIKYSKQKCYKKNEELKIYLEERNRFNEKIRDSGRGSRSLLELLEDGVLTLDSLRSGQSLLLWSQWSCALGVLAQGHTEDVFPLLSLRSAIS